ncbi:MAG TPA: aspartate kinase [Chloroflexi bacterium]|nr:aspartate kinase [Chloroflexota bacterium]
MTLVMKFGGTSVGSAKAIQRTANIILNNRSEWPQQVIIASAMSGVTDLLFEGATSAASGDAVTYREVAKKLRQKHFQVISELLPTGDEGQQLTAQLDKFIERYESLCKAVLVLGELTPRALDAMTSIGERMSVRLIASYLRHRGQSAQAIDATELIVTDDTFQGAVPLMDNTTVCSEARLRPLLEEGVVTVVTGFIGANEKGVVTTLGRGGSDYSAAILGQALHADEVWIWTDVDGVMTADPRLVPEAQTISTLSYREVAELAFYGAKVLHPKTIRPVVENNIPLWIKNTFHPEKSGTEIVQERSESNGDIKAVTAIRNLSLVVVEGKGMLGVPGIAARTFGAVARSNISVLLISQASSEQSICFAVPAQATKDIVSGLELEFRRELMCRDIDRITAQERVAIVTVVGAGMRGTPGIAGRLFSALGDRQVNIIAIAQGSSECSISMVVDNLDTAEAEKAIHALIISS